MSMESPAPPYQAPPTDNVNPDHPVLQQSQQNRLNLGKAIMQGIESDEAARMIDRIDRNTHNPVGPIDALRDESLGYDPENEPDKQFYRDHTPPGDSEGARGWNNRGVELGEFGGTGVIPEGGEGSSGRLATREEIAAQSGIQRDEVHAQQPDVGTHNETKPLNTLRATSEAMIDARARSALPKRDADANFEHDIGIVMKVEGLDKKTRDPGGGRTRWGISEKNNPDAWKNGPPTKEKAIEIYKQRYWDRLGVEKLDPALRLAAFDAAVNEGVGKARAMLEKSGENVQEFMKQRYEHYDFLRRRNIHKARKYYHGWINRLHAISEAWTTDV